MFDSVRLKLTLWYSLVLAVVLIALAVLTYLLYWHNISKRADSDLLQLSDAFVSTFRAELADEKGPSAVQSAAHEAMLEHRFRGTFFIVLNSAGVVQQNSGDLAADAASKESLSSDFLSSNSFRRLVSAQPGEVRAVHVGREGFRGLLRLLSVPGQQYLLVVLQSLRPQREMMEDIRNTFLWAIPIALLLAGSGGFFLARKALAPIAAMASEARAMGADNLHRRLPVANERDELGQLARTFNQLLERLEMSFEQQRRFMADASHELRTPVTILRSEAEVTLSQPERSAAEYRDTITVLREESQRLTHIIEDLFTLARADAHQYPLTLREMYLDEVACEAVTRARSLAASKNITLTSAITSDLPFCGDEALLGRMLLNLLDNAIKYSPPASAVNLSCQREADRYVISVSDNGSGIPSELQPRIFERFFRADKARSRAEGETGGAGLGLAIARWIADAHHGRLELTRSDSSGSTFTAILPAHSIS